SRAPSDEASTLNSPIGLALAAVHGKSRSSQTASSVWRCLRFLVLYNLYLLVVHNHWSRASRRLSSQSKGHESVNPKSVAERYFAAIRSRNIEDLMALYAEDATFVLPNGKEAKGIAAIRELHQSVFNAVRGPSDCRIERGGNTLGFR